MAGSLKQFHLAPGGHPSVPTSNQRMEKVCPQFHLEGKENCSQVPRETEVAHTLIWHSFWIGSCCLPQANTECIRSVSFRKHQPHDTSLGWKSLILPSFCLDFFSPFLNLSRDLVWCLSVLKGLLSHLKTAAVCLIAWLSILFPNWQVKKTPHSEPAYWAVTSTWFLGVRNSRGSGIQCPVP